MVNKCAAPKCNTGYSTNHQDKKISSFHFPLANENLNKKWTHFVNRADWTPSKNSVLCELHFEDRYLLKGKRTTLIWCLEPVPTIHSKGLESIPSVLPTTSTSRKPPLKRVFQDDQLDEFKSRDSINSINDLHQYNSPPGFEFQHFDNSVVFYRLKFDDVTQFPVVLESIRVDQDLHVKLQYNGIPLPLPPWFVKGNNAKLTKFSMLENFPAYIRSTAIENQQILLDELKQRALYKPKGRPPYSSSMIRFALHLRYTSLQTYKLLIEKLPLPSISLLNKIQQGGVDSLKALTILRGKGEISNDLIMMFDEMYLQKAAQYQSGEYVGADEEGNLYKGIVAFMVVGLKQSVPFVVQAIPEVTFDGRWLCEKIAKNIKYLADSGFSVRGIVSDNHSSNVNAFTSLKTRFNSDTKLYFEHPDNHGKRTYMFFDTVHLMKNVRNNLLNGKKFVFPEFSYNKFTLPLICPSGYISWTDLHGIYDKDKGLKGNLRKAPKLSYQVLHPGNNKQSVPLALSIFHETTVAAVKSYCPNREDFSGFLNLINTWWTISNSKQRFTPNPLGNAVVLNDNKTNFFRVFAFWVQEWSLSPAFTLTKQTSSALIQTLRSQALLIDELLNDGYDFVCTARFQSDPIERRYSRYRQMSGGRFLVSLREVLNTERILACRSLIKEDVNFWNEDVRPEVVECDEGIDEVLGNYIDEISESVLDKDSSEVATTISGFVAKKLLKRSKCVNCQAKLRPNNDDLDNDEYLNLLSRGGLFVPSKELADYICSCFAILDFVEKEVLHLIGDSVTKNALYILNHYGPSCTFCCQLHCEWGVKFASKVVVNIYFNNKQKQAQDAVRKEMVSEFKTRQRSK